MPKWVLISISPICTGQLNKTRSSNHGIQKKTCGGLRNARLLGVAALLATMTAYLQADQCCFALTDAAAGSLPTKTYFLLFLFWAAFCSTECMGTHPEILTFPWGTSVNILSTQAGHRTNEVAGLKQRHQSEASCHQTIEANLGECLEAVLI